MEQNNRYFIDSAIVNLTAVLCLEYTRSIDARFEWPSAPASQTGKYVKRAEDLPRANILSCALRPIKRAEFGKYSSKYAISFREAMQGWFFQARKFDLEKYLPRTESKLSSLASQFH